MHASSVRQDKDYWLEKIAAFLHDPPDKALSLYDHIQRAQVLRERLYVSAQDDLVKKADQVASGLDRTFVPDSDRGGFVDFTKNPIITHPTGTSGTLQLKGVPRSCNTEELARIVSSDEEKFAPDNHDAVVRNFRLFHYLRHVFPHRLAENQVCGMSWEWLRLPADTRIPDHTIWQHCALTSALYSCYALSPERKASVMVFSITPVQDFIARSRKLRDYWIASLILSWLAAEGMKAVVVHYGSDHIVYPWPVGQPIMEIMLDQLCHFPNVWARRYTVEPQAATLPNKFVVLVPSGDENSAAGFIEEAITQAWKKTSQLVLKFVVDKCFGEVPKECIKAFDEIFRRQIDHFWEFNWAAAPLLDEREVSRFSAFLPGRLRENLQSYLKDAKEKSFPYISDTEKFFYPLSHDLVQRGLAATKLSPENLRPQEPGIKCHLHTDLEALRFSCVECASSGRACELRPGKAPDPNPRPTQDPCWQKIREFFGETEFKSTERLSAIGLIKRLIYRVVNEAHPLYSFFGEDARFPSTTEVAASEWLERAKREIERHGLKLRDVAEILHRRESPRSEWNEIEVIDRNREHFIDRVIKIRSDAGDAPHIVDRYYALLVMDGDRMGKLLAGGFAATWKDVIHRKLVERIEKKGEVDKVYCEFWKDYFGKKRALSPSVHGAISQALSEYALYTVPAIVAQHSGRLIYAGGDDVCAVFPVSTALSAARCLAAAYNWAFVKVTGDNGSNEATPTELKDVGDLSGGDRLLMHLGLGDEISISAGLLLVHHKWPLRAAIHRAHELLELAKTSCVNSTDRAAMAVSLHRRAGGERIFVAGFRDVCLGKNVWDAFEKIVSAISERRLSSSLLYGLADLEEGLLVLRNDHDAFVKLVRSQIARSETSDIASAEELAKLVSVLLLGRRRERGISCADEGKISTEVLEICAFIAEALRRKTNSKRSGYMGKEYDASRAVA